MGTCIAKVFELTASCTGANSHKLEQNGIDVVTSITQSQDHVSYYPGAKPQTIKLLYSPHDGRLLGAQVVGYDGVDRTIDALATALTAEMTVFDLEHLELAYAPPFGAAKDPVNIAGYVASNRLRGDTELVQWHEIEDLDPETQGILDVRTDVERSLGHIPGSVHIPQTELRERLDELSREKEWIIYCAIGQRAYIAERVLKQNGYRVKNLTGGWEIYSVATEEQSNLDTQRKGDIETTAPEEIPTGTLSTRGEQKVPASPITSAIDLELNACGLQCPGPIMKVYNKMQEMQRGQVLRVQATDPGFRRDVQAWCEQTGNTLLSLERNNGHIVALLQKGEAVPLQVTEGGTLPKGKTVVVFSADLDRALAAFVIANGAAAMGQEVTMFFTFWGLNILRRKERVATKKNIVEKMFGWMLPKGPEALKLSKLNMGGLGTEMMKRVMKAKNVDSLSELLAAAQENGVKLVACQMSMDMMGIKEEELIDGVEVGGVATYIGETDKGNASLFI
jgi:peroxiredoxin family protein/TusA-related sulfurtransferase/rhodanese-related sulfurtransferase